MAQKVVMSCDVCEKQIADTWAAMKIIVHSDSSGRYGAEVCSFACCRTWISAIEAKATS
jgi:hypothetical protein